MLIFTKGGNESALHQTDTKGVIPVVINERIVNKIIIFLSII